MIKIHTPPHTLFAAQILCEKLNTFGYPAAIVDNIDRRDPDIYIVYNAAAHNFISLPKHYIVMQTEVPGSHWFSPAYHKIIKHAIAVWDYCESNQSAYEHPKKAIVTPGIRQPGVYKKDIDYMFYGWIEGSKRRRRILDELQKSIPIMEVTNTLGPPMWDLLKRTKFVVNIHYHDNSPIEKYRVHEAWSFGCMVATEMTYWRCADDPIKTADELLHVMIKSHNDDSPTPKTNEQLFWINEKQDIEIQSALKQAGI